MERQLIDYLPPFMQVYQEIQRIIDALQPEISDSWDDATELLDDQFLLYMSEKSVTRWEKILNIRPKDTDELGDRKFRIESRLNGSDLPYTISKLEFILTNLCGEGAFSISMNGYNIKIKLGLSNKSMYDDVEKLLTEIIPANMMRHIQIMYNRHETFEPYTHEQMAQYTHMSLREDVV